MSAPRRSLARQRPLFTMAGVDQLMLRDKVVVIIGGTTGLGLSGAAACVRAGAKVVVVGRDAEHAQAAVSDLGESSRQLVGDATDPRTASQAIELALSDFGRFDALYHVAGGSGRSFGDGPLDAISDE